MDKELKAKWIEALRSGQYKQGKGQLRDTPSDTYCCLGVLLTVANEPFLSAVTLKGAQEEKFGISTEQRCKLESMNDGIDERGRQGGREYDFSEIADYIEANL